jgi:hypothetical protein
MLDGKRATLEVASETWQRLGPIPASRIPLPPSSSFTSRHRFLSAGLDVIMEANLAHKITSCNIL